MVNYTSLWFITVPNNKSSAEPGVPPNGAFYQCMCIPPKANILNVWKFTGTFVLPDLIRCQKSACKALLVIMDLLRQFWQIQGQITTSCEQVLPEFKLDLYFHVNFIFPKFHIDALNLFELSHKQPKSWRTTVWRWTEYTYISSSGLCYKTKLNTTKKTEMKEHEKKVEVTS